MREYKVIVFDEPEIVSALSGIRRRQGRPLPPGNVAKIQLHGGEDVSVSLHIDLDRGGTEVETFQAAEIAAGFIALCIDRNVPLPAVAPKTATLIDNRWLALLIHPLQDGKVKERRAG